MNNSLKKIFNETIRIFKEDPRILAAWHIGSAAAKCDDQYSDVDPVFMVKREYFDEVDRELKTILGAVSSKIHLWWAEEFNNDTIRNYAVLLESEGIHQYDITIMRESDQYEGMAGAFFESLNENNVIFDKANLLKNRVSPGIAGNPPSQHDPAQVRHLIEKYWLFVFISVKYFMRKSVFKIAYARDELRTIHLRVLQMSAGGGDWSWWPQSIEKNLDSNQKNEFLSYFSAPDMDSLKEGFIKHIRAFSKDATAFCNINHIEYPESLENNVMRCVDGAFDVSHQTTSDKHPK